MSNHRRTLSVSDECYAKVVAFVRRTKLHQREAVELCIDIGLRIFSREVEEAFKRIDERIADARSEALIRN